MYKRIKKYKIQGKTHSHRESLTMSQVIELIRAEKIKTTPTKARVLKSQFDKIVTHAKRNTVSGKREVQSFFRSNTRAIERFYKVVETQLNDRNSGYTRVVNTLPRKGDNADQVYVALVNMSEDKDKKSKIEKALEAQTKKKPKKVKAESKTDKK